MSTPDYSQPAGGATRLAAVVAAALAFLVLAAISVFVAYAGLLVGAALVAGGLAARRRGHGALATAALVAGAILFLLGLVLALSYADGGGSTDIHGPTPAQRR